MGKETKVNKNWRTTAIIFIVLFGLLLTYLVWATSIGTEIIEQEAECASNVCNMEEFDAYQYDAYEEVCYCFKEQELAYQEYMG